MSTTDKHNTTASSSADAGSGKCNVTASGCNDTGAGDSDTSSQHTASSGSDTAATHNTSGSGSAGNLSAGGSETHTHNTTASSSADTTASSSADTNASSNADTTASSSADTTASSNADTTASSSADTTASSNADTTPSDGLSRLQRLDGAHHFHPFTDQGELNRSGSRVFVRGEGIYVYTEDGSRLLDAMSGLWCVNVGYGREELVEAAATQMRRLVYYNSFFQCTTDVTAQLAHKLATLAPNGIDHCFFASSGSEVNDTAIRVVRHFWACQGQPEKFWFISRHNAYHGSTMGGASLGGMAAMHAQGGLPIPGVAHIDQPYWFGESVNETPEAFGLRVARQLEDKIIELGAHNVGAFIGEPVQGAGGVIIPPQTYWPEIQRICRKHDVLLIADEVICAFGRLGHWFGSEHFGIQPDLISTAKGLSSGYAPIGALLYSNRIAQVLLEQGGEFNHGYTYSGHPMCAAVALRNLELIEKEGLVEQVRTNTGPYLSQALAQFNDHPLVGQTRSQGLIGALELVEDKQTNKRWHKDAKASTICRQASIENGLIMRASTTDTMMLSPPLIINQKQIDELCDRLKATLNDTQKALENWKPAS